MRRSRNVFFCLTATACLFGIGSSAAADDSGHSQHHSQQQQQQPHSPPAAALPPPVDEPAPGGTALRPGTVAVPAPSGGGEVICVPKVQEERQPVAGGPAAECTPTGVHFETNSAELNEDARTILENNARCLKSNPDMEVTIVGGADRRGTSEYNLDLGKRRADSVSQYLVAQGADPEQLKARTVGKDVAICTDDSPECLARNRRATIAPSHSQGMEPGAQPRTQPGSEPEGREVE